MGRTNTRRSLTLENLEGRQLLTTGGPSPDAQYTLEVLNLVRTDPAKGAEWVAQNADEAVQENMSHYQVDLNQVKSAIASAAPRQPLAWNRALAGAAQGHSDDMARNRFQSHTGSDGLDTAARMDRAGVRDRIRASENAFAYASSVNNALEAFLIDWGVADNGHRRNILEPDSSDDGDSSAEVGIGIAETSRLGARNLVMTQDFARQRGARGQLVGVVFDDRDRNGRFSMNEGVGDATVEVQNLQNGQTQSIQTWDAGGYQVALDPGSYQATARVGGRVLGTQRFTIGRANVKADFKLDGAPAAVASLAAPAPTPPAPAPQPQQPETPPTVKAATATAPTGDDWSGLAINWSRRWKAR